MNKSGLNILRPAFSALLLLCTFLLTISCKESQDEPLSAYLGGEIVNPHADYLLLKYKGDLVDTIKLNDKNKFSYRLENVETGVYIIEHRPESQNVFLTAGDSILFRVNTLAFDESLHFSGKGQEKNNFMNEMFLEDEKTARILLSFYEYTPSQFSKVADSIYEARLELLEQRDDKYDFSDRFLELSKKIILYENRDLKERYTYLLQKYYREYVKQIPPDFHDYRQEINFNSELLQSSPGYRRFLENFLINYSLNWCAQSGLDSEDCYNLSNEENVKARIRRAGELIELPSLRQYMLKKIAVRGIVMAKSRDSIIRILQVLEEQNISQEDLDEMRQLGTIQLAFLPGISLNIVPLVNMEGKLITFDDVIERPTVVFLWSFHREFHMEEHRIINQYRKKYPEIDFLGINLDVGEEPAWRVAVRRNNYPNEFEYQLAPTSIEKEFFRYYVDKLLFLNASGEVVKGDIFLNSPEFESYLVEFINQ